MEARRNGRRIDISGRGLPPGGGKPPVGLSPTSPESEGGSNAPKSDLLAVPKQVEENREVQRKWSDVMDAMEASVSTRGRFFVRIGGRPHKYSKINGDDLGVDNNAVDTRAMILAESRREGLGVSVYTAITRNGAQEIRFDAEPGDEVPSFLRNAAVATSMGDRGVANIESYKRKRQGGGFTLPEIMQRLTDGEQFLEPNEDAGFKVSDNGIGHIIFGRLPKVDRVHGVVESLLALNLVSYTATPVGGNMDSVAAALNASYASAKLDKDAPNSPEAKALKAKSDEAGRVLGMVQGLPPKK